MKSKQNIVLAIIFAVLLFVSMLLTGNFLWQNRKLETQTKSSSLSSTPPPIPSTTIIKESTVVVTTIPKDTTPPKAYILSPESGQHVRAPVKIVANVTDNVKVDRVEFYAGSSNYQHIGTVTQAPFEVFWTPVSGFNGYGNANNIPVYIKAFDSSGNRSDSSISVFLDQ